jgi:C4-type Zn-finger protein
MPLTPEQQQSIAQHLNVRGSTPTCPICGASNMRVRPEVVRLPRQDADGGVTVAMVDCQYCGHLMYFSADVLGLDVEKATDDPGSASADSEGADQA